MNPPTMEFMQLLNFPTPWVESVLNLDTDDINLLSENLLSRWSVQELAIGVRAVIDNGAPSRFSFLFGSIEGRHVVLELIALFGRDLQRELLLHIAISESLYIPYDLRAAAFGTLKRDIDAGFREVTSKLAVTAASVPKIAYKNLMFSTSNDIDHTFEIPDGRSDRNKILLEASQVAMYRSRSRLANRALGRSSYDPAANALFAPSHVCIPEDVVSVFKQAIKAPGLDWRDFIIDWNEVLTVYQHEQFSVSEILRFLLLDGEYHLPGHTQRSIADAVYINILKTFSGASIGLKGGIIFVEHGFKPESSFFLMCENAILGKSCVIDATGVVVIEAKAFLGGGFSPILIHTHKHMKGCGANERKRVTPTGFRACSRARLPMEFVGLLEVLEMEPARWPGIERIGVLIKSRDEIWGAE